ncbi:unnamed protein product [Protopolystoma xenopodis]|uniref:Uncharacterized protein n=1 Tax=Protopolystoma xenopodis TaxID=117903 RepID=A0A448XJ50_9PLAT|nr:unnamed protein product [Protopolystoma xenopodis]
MPEPSYTPFECRTGRVSTVPIMPDHLSICLFCCPSHQLDLGSASTSHHSDRDRNDELDLASDGEGQPSPCTFIRPVLFRIRRYE